MNRSKTLCVLLCVVAGGVVALSSVAEDEPNAPPAAALAAGTGVVPTPAVSMPAPGRPRGVAPGALKAARTTAGATAASFVAEEKWGLAGYNNNEPIYTILVTSHDPRILRCTADLKGTYIENGEKQSVTDRQTATVFPNAQVQMGNWSGMDQQSGATYTVKCRPI